ncbi:MAG TPA: hypothetical protein PK280_14090 [Planctomycetota bacterium]|nr:hypothetical protein [Planctomycetota bacterium]
MKKVVLICLGFWLLLGCYEQPVTSPVFGKAADDQATEKACLAFATKIETSVNAGDPSFLDRNLDCKAILSTAVAGVSAPAEWAKEFRDGALAQPPYGQELCADIGTGGLYRLLRIHTVEGERRALFRYVSGDHRLQYHDYVLAVSDTGTVKAVDVYMFLSGELLSQTMRSGFLGYVADLQKKRDGQLSKSDVKHLADAASMRALADAGKFQEALAIYKGLPDALKRDKNLMFVRFQCALGIGGGGREYSEAMDDFVKLFPRADWLDLMLIDACFLGKRYEDALAAVDRLDRALGGDPYLDAIRADIRLAQGRWAEARQLARRTLESEPGLLQPHKTIMSAALKQNDFRGLAEVLIDLEEKHGQDMSGITAIPDFAAFVKTDEYRKWQASRKQSVPAPPTVGGN